MKVFFVIAGSLFGLFVLGVILLFVQAVLDGKYYRENCRVIGTTGANYSVRTVSSSVTITKEHEYTKYLCPDGKVHWY